MKYIVLAILCLLGGCVILGAWLLPYLDKWIPEDYEDKDGFRYGKPRQGELDGEDEV